MDFYGLRDAINSVEKSVDDLYIGLEGIQDEQKHFLKVRNQWISLAGAYRYVDAVGEIIVCIGVEVATVIDDNIEWWRNWLDAHSVMPPEETHDPAQST